jgi:hypothetical protein
VIREPHTISSYDAWCEQLNSEQDEHVPPLSNTERITALYKMLDAIRAAPGISWTSIFEHDCPGVADTLRAWAESYGYDLQQKTVGPQNEPLQITRCVLPNGTSISVQERIAS